MRLLKWIECVSLLLVIWLLQLQTSAHVQSFIEVDVTNIVKWREKNKNAFEERRGEVNLYSDIYGSCCQSFERFSGLNVVGDYIIKKKNINLGMAASLLTVP
jgi:2-oxoglutarate dehydrogenase E2 component (dihydrolipoamide succinyltransferase)